MLRTAVEESLVAGADRRPEGRCFGDVEVETVSEGRDDSLQELGLPREQPFVGGSGSEVEAESVAVAVCNFSKSPVAIAQLAQPDTVRAILAFRRSQRQGLRQASSKSDVDEV